MNGQVIDYLPAGAVPPSPRAGYQEKLTMLTEAMEVHDDECCTDLAPCIWRTPLRIQLAETRTQLGLASDRISIPDPEPTRPQGSGQISRRAVADLASNPQLGLISRLVGERTPADLPVRHARTLAEIQAGDPVSKTRAGDLITALLATARKIQTPHQTSDLGTRASRTPAVTEDGMYRTPDGQIYKVQVAIHGSGRLYAKKLVELAIPRVLKNNKIRTHGFEIEQGAIGRLTPTMKMTRAEAVEFGKLYGTCCRCGLALTDDESIDRGLGKVCYTKF